LALIIRHRVTERCSTQSGKNFFPWREELPTPIKYSHGADLSSVIPVTIRVADTRTDPTKIIKMKEEMFY